jgi:hypothetical protein
MSHKYLFYSQFVQGPEEKTDTFMLSSINQCKEVRGLQGHRYADHAQEFGWEHTSNNCDG